MTLSGALHVAAAGSIDVTDRGLRGGNRDGNSVGITGPFVYGEGYDANTSAAANVANGATRIVFEEERPGVDVGVVVHAVVVEPRLHALGEVSLMRTTG